MWKTGKEKESDRKRGEEMTKKIDEKYKIFRGIRKNKQGNGGKINRKERSRGRRVEMNKTFCEI